MNTYAATNNTQLQRQHLQVPHMWTKPTHAFYKINTDATLFNESSKYGVAICIRGENESFVAAKSMTFDSSPELGISTWPFAWYPMWPTTWSCKYSF